ncbi:MAG: class I SAM-dependent methyltransferase [Ktedonobacterales bacterium]
MVKQAEQHANNRQRARHPHALRTKAEKPQACWDENASEIFIDFAPIFVPARMEQIATLRNLIPAQPDEVFTIAELAAGDGALAQTLLAAFPNCRYLALDGSPSMRIQLKETLAPYRERVEVRDFDIMATGWREELPLSLRCVTSSLCVHHLDGQSKRQLFADMAACLEPGGALLLADIVEPRNQRVADLYADQYEELVRAQSLAQRGDLSGYQRFCDTHWNFFRYDYGDPASGDRPSPLFDQLLWMLEAGLHDVDCFWLRAGHAIYGGWK